MEKIHTTGFCEKMAATLNGMSGVESFRVVSKPRTATMHTAKDWEGLVFSVESSEKFNTDLAMFLFVSLLATYGLTVYQTFGGQTVHYVMKLSSEDGRYPGFVLSSRCDKVSGSVCMTVRGHLLNDTPDRNIYRDVGGNFFFCTKLGNSAYELRRIQGL